MSIIKYQVPFGGFFVAKGFIENLDKLKFDFAEKGAQTFFDEKSDIFMSAFQELPNQGIWYNKDSAVAYDLDLTNEADLKKMVRQPDGIFETPGRLLWELYFEFGIEFLNYLKGAYGFTLWDGKKNKLIFATDPYGIRPVVYSYNKKLLMAASRIRHLSMSSQFSTDINAESIFHYLFFSVIPSPLTIFRNVRKLEAGKMGILSSESFNETTHYDISYQSDYKSKYSYWIEQIPKNLETAVRKFVPHSKSEKTGCFLSGGTDSSSIAGYFTKIAKKPAKTFSVGYDIDEYNELGFAEIAAREYNTEHYEYVIKPQDVLDLVDLLPKLYEEPFGNSSVVPAFFCANLAREYGIEVLLGGDGGDEIFGGNERYAKNLVFELYNKIPLFFRDVLLEPFIKILPNKPVFYRAKRYIRRANIKNPERFFSYNLLAELDSSEIFQPDYLDSIDTNCFAKLAKKLYQKTNAIHTTDRLLYIDMKLTITDNDLRKVTQMVEASGLQVRYPFLDRDLVDFAATIPPELKVKIGKNRYIFKQAMKGFLPPEIINKPKHGMALPIASWFKTDSSLSAFLNDILFCNSSKISTYVQPSFLEKMKIDFQSDETSYYGSNFWVFLMLELWLRQFKI